MQLEIDDMQLENDTIELWESDGESISTSQNIDAIPGMKVVRLLSVFLLTWQAFFRIPDVAMGVLLKFIKVLMSSLTELFGSQKLHEMLKVMPDTLAKTRTTLSIDREGFQRFIVCQKCDSTYDYNDCFPTRQIVNCTYVRFPRHPQVHMRTKCNEPLLKTVKTTTGKRLFMPLKVFLYKSLIDLIKDLIQQPGTLCSV